MVEKWLLSTEDNCRPERETLETWRRGGELEKSTRTGVQVHRL